MIWPGLLALSIWSSSARARDANVHHEVRAPVDEDATDDADTIADQVEKDSDSAKSAADAAKQAAIVANKVAEHSVKITTHAKEALKHAQSALHDARVDTEGLDGSQKESLKKAEAKLREASKTAEYGELKKVKDADDLKKDQMKGDLDKKDKTTTELEQMQQDVKELRKKLKERGGDEETDKALDELEEDLEQMEKDGSSDTSKNDEMKAEIERLHDQIDQIEDEGQVDYKIPKEKKGKKGHELPKGKKGELMRDVKMKPLEEEEDSEERREDKKHEATPVEEKGIDIDTQMPYGDLEPFGREDTAQELTESSVRESDEMVDQLERAEVAEEKRAVFRALTRLRGAAITSFDGVARSQTGNIDEYNKIHKWRKSHPVHHLADEEADITKWAFPDNADLVQMKRPVLHKVPTDLVQMEPEPALVHLLPKVPSR